MNSGTHRRRNRDRPDKHPFGCSRFQGSEIGQECKNVLDKFIVAETQLTNRGTNIAALVVTKLNLTSLELTHGRDYVCSHCSRSRRWHQTTRTQNTTERANQTHHIRCCKSNIEIHHTIFDQLRQIFGTDNIGSLSSGFLCVFALSEHRNTNCFTNPVRQSNCSANILIALLRIDAEIG